MQDLLSSASEWLNGMRQEHLSRYVSYVRNGISMPCPATVAATTFEMQSDMGVVERWESRDFIISVNQFPQDIPMRGDTITENLDGTTVTYQVCAPKGMPVFRYADPYRKAFRVFTKALEEG
jgi:hypothetical protein